MWEFVVPEDEAGVQESNGNDKQAEFRPQRMGLGCSKEMIQEKISENAKKSRLTKLLKRQEIGMDDSGKATSTGLKRSRLEDDSDDELSKTSLITKKTPPINSSTGSVQIANAALSKSQRKRLKQKLKTEQKKRMNS